MIDYRLWLTSYRLLLYVLTQSQYDVKFGELWKQTAKEGLCVVIIKLMSD